MRRIFFTLPLFTICSIITSLSHAQTTSISKEKAYTIVQSFYPNQNVDYYFLPERTNNLSFFVDEVPHANWAHKCAIYTFHNTGDSSIDIIPEIQYFTLPPAEEMTLLSSKNARAISYAFSVPNVTPSFFLKPDIEVANRTYAVIVNGGYYRGMNNSRYWKNCSFIYQTLRKTYCIPRSNIEVLMADGTDPGADMKLQNKKWISSPLDLDSDGIDDIKYAATQENIENVLETLRAKMCKGDHLLFFMTGHGVGYNIKKSITYLLLWGDNSSVSNPNRRLYDYELTEMLKDFVEMGINVNVVASQCHSGGFIDDLETIGCVVSTAASIDEASYAMSDSIDDSRDFDEFIYHWTSALNGFDTNGKYIDADYNQNGRISMLEAFTHAKQNDKYFTHPTPDKFETPQYASAPPSLGEDIALNYLPQAVDLYIKDGFHDRGVENSQMEDSFWQSPSIWVRNTDDNEDLHENPYYSGNDSIAYVYVKVHNRGKENYTGGTKWVHINWAQASTALTIKSWKGCEIYNGHPTGGALSPVAIPAIESGDSCTVKVLWHLPTDLMSENTSSNTHHLCLLARILDTPVIEPYEECFPMWYDIRGLNNYAQKNVTSISKTQTAKSTEIFVRNITDCEQLYTLELRPHSPRDTTIFSKANIELTLSQPILDAWAFAGHQGENIAYSQTNNPTKVTMLSKDSKLTNICMQEGVFGKVSFKFDFHTGSIPGTYYTFDVIQKDEDDIIAGGQTYIIEAPTAILIDGGIYPIEPSPIEPFPNDIITLGANLDGSELISEWTDETGSVIGESITVDVIPTAKNNTYSLRVLTGNGDLYNDSITLEPTRGIKSVSFVNEDIVIDFINTTTSANSRILIQSITSPQNASNYFIPIGENKLQVNATNMSPGVYSIVYIIDGQIIDTKKINKQTFK